MIGASQSELHINHTYEKIAWPYMCVYVLACMYVVIRRPRALHACACVQSDTVNDYQCWPHASSKCSSPNWGKKEGLFEAQADPRGDYKEVGDPFVATTWPRLHIIWSLSLMYCSFTRALTQSMHPSHTRVKTLDSTLHWQPRNISL